MTDPFDPGNVDTAAPGMLGQSPDFWRNIANLGANMSVAANARTPQGFLTYGPGMAGALGAATLGAQQQGMEIAKLRSGMGLQGAQAQNLLTDAALKQYQIPFLQQQMQLMQHVMNGTLPGMGGAPLGQPGGPSGQPAAAPSSSPLSPGQRFDIVTNAVKGTPIPADLATTLIGHESSWDPGKVNPDTGAFGLGQTLPSTAANPGFGMSPLPRNATPQQQTDWAVRYLWARGKAAGIQDTDWNDPAKVASALTAYHGPQTDANGVSGPAYANAVQNNAPFQVAQAGNGPVSMPNGGGADYTQSPAYQRAQQLYKLSSVFGMSPFTRTLAETYKSQADQLMQLALAGPIAGARAQNSNVDLRQGGMARIMTPNGPEWVKNPQLEKVQNPDGSFSYVHIAPALPGSPPGTPGTMEPVAPIQRIQAAGTPTNAPAAPVGATAAISPQQHEFLKERGESLGRQFEQIDEDAAAAVRSNFLFDNLRNDSRTWNMGKLANAAGEARAWLSAVAHAFNVDPSGIDQKLGDFQAFNKSSGILLREAVRKVSSRAAVQEYKMIGDTLPAPTTSERGFGQVADQWQALNDYEVAKQKFAHGYQGDPQNFNVEWNGKVSPTSFLLHRMTQTPGGQQDFSAMVARMQQTPEGKQTLAKMRRDYYFAQQQGLFDDLPPIGASAVQTPSAAPAGPATRGP